MKTREALGVQPGAPKWGGNSPQLRAVYVTKLTTTGDIGSRIKSALVDGLLDIFETRPESAIALGQAILRIWPGFRGV